MAKIVCFDWIPAGQSEFDIYTRAQLLAHSIASSTNIRIDKPYSDFVCYLQVFDKFLQLGKDPYSGNNG
uniref:Uncharacterized protein n=1 Tax=Magallana gigas TaxID=29159 RepID=K1R7V2_MAGGI